MLSEDVSEDDRRVLDEWLASSRENREAFAAFEALIARADEAMDESACAALEADLEEFARAPATPRRRFAGAAAALAMAASLMVFALFFIPRIGPEPPPSVYATAKGEIEEIALADGGAVTLNTDTIVEIDYDRDRRAVTVVGGEAFFEVRRDPDRPFVVSAGEVVATVVGTNFDVYTDQTETVIRVFEGVVEVSLAGVGAGAGARASMVKAGLRARARHGDAQLVVEPFDAEGALSWIKGFVIYDAASLADVVADLNRYYEVGLRIDGAEIAALPVSGRFNLRDQQATIEALKVALSLESRRSENGEYILYQDR